MKFPAANSPSARTINECPPRTTEPALAHSKGKPDVSSTTTNINVRFATPLPLEIPIRVADDTTTRRVTRPSSGGDRDFFRFSA